jgi:hypothetical protein
VEDCWGEEEGGEEGEEEEEGIGNEGAGVKLPSVILAWGAVLGSGKLGSARYPCRILSNLSRSSIAAIRGFRAVTLSESVCSSSIVGGVVRVNVSPASSSPRLSSSRR